MLSAAFIAAVASAAQPDMRTAAAYPTRPIRLIVPFGAGGGPDLTTRVLATALSAQLGQAFVIDNRAGAAGTIGTELIVRAAPDGYTLGLGSVSSLAINPAMLDKLPYDPIADTQKVVVTYYAPNLLAVTPALPAKSVKDLVDLAKASPGKLSFGSNGSGTSGHLSGELFKYMTGTQMMHVPYKASQQVITDLAADRIQVTFNNIGALLPHVKSGRLRGLGVTGLKRSPAVPDLPAVAETIPRFEATVWSGVITPRGVNRAIVDRLQLEINKALATPAVAEKYMSMGYEPGGGTPPEFEAFAKSEAAKWGGVVRRSGAKAD
ncbi:MAG TPA: tripartite tricarboxylate transporter substrate binding protein [Burkholderiales bacterium]|nr:tripartite tricarboxylate transporter substrate binding protein [Burkholderiales bacterium]